MIRLYSPSLNDLSIPSFRPPGNLGTMKHDPTRITFVSRFCITLVATLCIASLTGAAENLKPQPEQDALQTRLEVRESRSVVRIAGPQKETQTEPVANS